MLTELAMFGRYARGLQSYFRETIDLAQAKQLVAKGAQNREVSLLHLLRRGVWDQPASPYRALLVWAGLEWGDLDSMINRNGVDSALDKLHSAGVYLTLDEFKGKKPIQRSGLDIATSHEDFDNPLLTVHFHGLTGGSRGPRRRLLVDLGMIGHDAAAHRVFLESFGLFGRPSAVWRSVPPNNSGIKKPLMAARAGARIDRWFSAAPTSWSPSEFKYAAFTAYTVLAARMAGRAFPYPEHVPREKTDVIVRWLAAMTAAGTSAFLDGNASAAVRICTVARELGVDISGTMFRTGGEPLTPARADLIAKQGARAFSHYATSETGPIGMACEKGLAPDDVHILAGKMAVLQKEQSRSLQEAGGGIQYLTTLFPACPKILLNVDTGDSGILEQRRCGCLFDELGLYLHLHHIRSHEKLTSEGILLSGAALVHLIEEVLPSAFGGSPADYQLVEDDFQGLPRVRIAVSPRLGPLDEDKIVATVLGAIHQTDAGGRLMAEELRQARSLSVIRIEPFQTPAAKTPALFVMPRK